MESWRSKRRIDARVAFKLGRFGGYVLSQHETEAPKVFVGRDTYLRRNARICLGGRSPLLRIPRLQTRCPCNTSSSLFGQNWGASAVS